MPRLENLTVQKFGRLKPIKYVDGKWECQCDCGGTATCLAFNLKRGTSTSCGCVRRELNTVHGGHGTPEHRVWCGMHQRCEQPGSISFPYYGGRGIKVCDEWSDFLVFFRDMGKRPPGMQLDRIDNDGPYCPGNCRWVTVQQNNRNKRNGTRITLNSKTLSITEWSEELDIPRALLYSRFKRGWTAERALQR